MPGEDGSSPVSGEAGPCQEEEHENMKNLLISTDHLMIDQKGMRRSRVVRSKSTFFLQDRYQVQYQHLNTVPVNTSQVFYRRCPPSVC